jgi:hypothetical protein
MQSDHRWAEALGMAEGYLDYWQAIRSRFYALEAGIRGIGEPSRPRSATNTGLRVLGGALTGMTQLRLQFRLGILGSRQ